MINTKKLMNCNAVNFLRKYYPYISEEEVIRTEIFMMNRYENGTLLDREETDFENDIFSSVDITDYYLRVTEDLDVIKIYDFDELMEYLLKRYYSCNSKNDYDYTFLFIALNKEIFINELIKNGVAKNIYLVDGNYYLFRDDYTFDHRYDLYLNYSENEQAVPF